MKIHWLEMIAAFAISVIALVCVLSIWPGLAGADGAAWAQGLITGLGICVALYTTDRQLKMSRLQRVEERREILREKRQSVYVIANKTKEFIDGFFLACTNTDRQHFYYEDWVDGQFTSAADVLRSVPLYELGSYHMVSGVMEMIAALDQCEILAKKLSSSKEKDADLLAAYWIGEQAKWTGIADKALVKIQGGANDWSDEKIILMCEGQPVDDF